MDLKQRIEKILPEVVELRHDLHRHPELGYEEERTASKVREFIGERPGVEIRTGVAGTGLLVTLGKDRPGPCVALRADMDALPMQEETEVPWKSTVAGKMHACGHDGHTAMLAGAARILADLQDELKGPVKFLFQPAEEGGGGGRRMCEEGVLNHPRVAAIFGLHNNLPDPAEKIGDILYSRGAAMAGTGTFTIEVLGVGGHAAFPHKCIDPLVTASAIVTKLQTIVSRRLNPLVPGVVSVTKIHGGSALNIIPRTAELAGTFRALDMDVLEDMRQAIVEGAEHIAKAHGAEVRVRCEIGYPVLVNSPRAEAAFREILAGTGDLGRLREVAPNMGGEDFAYFANEVPGFFYYLPACPLDRESIPMCHHPAFDFNDDLLPEGLRLHVETGRRFARVWKG